MMPSSSCKNLSINMNKSREGMKKAHSHQLRSSSISSKRLISLLLLRHNKSHSLDKTKSLRCQVQDIKPLSVSRFLEAKSKVLTLEWTYSRWLRQKLLKKISANPPISTKISRWVIIPRFKVWT
jgi:hypothetical protein